MSIFINYDDRMEVLEDITSLEALSIMDDFFYEEGEDIAEEVQWEWDTN